MSMYILNGHDKIFGPRPSSISICDNTTCFDHGFQDTNLDIIATCPSDLLCGGFFVPNACLQYQWRSKYRKTDHVELNRTSKAV